MMLEDFLQSLHGYFRTTGGEGGERGGGRGRSEGRGTKRIPLRFCTNFLV